MILHEPNEVAGCGGIAFALIEEDVALGVAGLGAESKHIQRGALAAAGPAQQRKHFPYKTPR